VKASLGIARNDLALTLRDRSSIFWIFIAPFLWVYFFGFLARPSDPSTVRVPLTVVQEDVSPQADAFVSLLESSGLSITRVRPGDGTDAAEAPRRVTIPAGFGEDIAARRPVTLPVAEGKDANPQSTFAAQVALHKAIVRLLAGEAFGPMEPADDLVTVAVSTATRKAVPSGVYQTIPGNLVMFVLLATLTYGAALLSTERRSGLLRRIACAPVSRSRILAGKLLGRMATAAVQVLVFLAIGLTLFRIDWGSAPLALGLLLLSFVFCAAALGLLSGSLFASGDAASGAGVVASLIMSAVAGCWWPAEVMPGWMQRASYAFPSSWALNGLHELISWGGDLSRVATHCVVLTLFGAGFLWLAVRRLDVTA
jgi:ABC-2 type transport system permease protein